MRWCPRSVSVTRTRRASSGWVLRSEQPAPFQRREDAGERSLGDARLGGDVTGLDLLPDPHHPQHDPARPREAVLGEHRPLEVVPDRAGRAVDVLDGGHGGHVQAQPVQALRDGALRLGQRAVLPGVATAPRPDCDACRPLVQPWRPSLQSCSFGTERSTCAPHFWLRPWSPRGVPWPSIRPRGRRPRTPRRSSPGSASRAWTSSASPTPTSSASTGAGTCSSTSSNGSPATASRSAAPPSTRRRAGTSSPSPAASTPGCPTSRSRPTSPR